MPIKDNENREQWKSRMMKIESSYRENNENYDNTNEWKCTKCKSERIVNIVFRSSIGRETASNAYKAQGLTTCLFL